MHNNNICRYFFLPLTNCFNDESHYYSFAHRYSRRPSSRHRTPFDLEANYCLLPAVLALFSTTFRDSLPF